MLCIGRSRRWPALLAVELLLGVLAAEYAVAQTLVKREPAIQPLPEFQAQIQRTAEAREDAQLFYREFIALSAMAQGREQEMVEQLAYFTQHITEGELGIRVLEVRRILDMMHHIDDGVIVAALAPYLNASDDGLRSLVQDWFESHDSVGGYQPIEALQPVNYSRYHGYIKGKLLKQEPLPQAFVDYIYKRPGNALLAFAYAYDNASKARKDPGSDAWPEDMKQLLWAEHVVSDAVWRIENEHWDRIDEIRPQAIAELEELSKHDAWWVRLYAAHVVKRHSQLAADGLKERLRKDKHVLIREALPSRTTPQQAPRAGEQEP